MGLLLLFYPIYWDYDNPVETVSNQNEWDGIGFFFMAHLVQVTLQSELGFLVDLLN